MAIPLLPVPSVEEEKNSELVFEYYVLPDASNYLRLVKVLEATDDEHLICSLRTWPIAQAPHYAAISYTWGKETSQRRIKINNRWLSIRDNCDYALRQASREHTSECRWFWIDSICIDQNNLDEKGHQVALMANIYSRATEVLSCAGRHADDSRFLFAMLRKAQHLFVVPASVQWTSAQRFHLGMWMLRLPTSKLKRMVEALKAFVRRSYFNRVWIVQEVFLARKGIFCCGFDSISTNSLVALSRLQVDCQFGYPLRVVGKIPIMRRLETRRHDPWWEGFEKGLCFSAIEGSSKKSLAWLSLIEQMGHLECADNRDRIYAILEIADNAQLKQLVPDYSISTLELAYQVIEIHQNPWTRQDLDKMAEALIISLQLDAAHVLGARLNTSVRPVEDQWQGTRIPRRLWPVIFGDRYKRNVFGRTRSKDHTYSESDKDDSGIVTGTYTIGDASLDGSFGRGESELIVPSHGEAGDWLLVPYVSRFWKVGLIVRSESDDRFGVVGPVLIRREELMFRGVNSEFLVGGLTAKELLVEKTLTMELDKQKFADISADQGDAIMERVALSYKNISIRGAEESKKERQAEAPRRANESRMFDDGTREATTRQAVAEVSRARRRRRPIEQDMEMGIPVH